MAIHVEQLSMLQGGPVNGAQCYAVQEMRARRQRIFIAHLLLDEAGVCADALQGRWWVTVRGGGFAVARPCFSATNTISPSQAFIRLIHNYCFMPVSIDPVFITSYGTMKGIARLQKL